MSSGEDLENLSIYEFNRFIDYIKYTLSNNIGLIKTNQNITRRDINKIIIYLKFMENISVHYYNFSFYLLSRNVFYYKTYQKYVKQNHVNLITIDSTKEGKVCNDFWFNLSKIFEILYPNKGNTIFILSEKQVDYLFTYVDKELIFPQFEINIPIIMDNIDNISSQGKEQEK